MNIKTVVISASFILIVAVSCSQSNSKNAAPEENRVGVEVNNAPSLPNFTMQDKEGNAVNLQSLKGKKVFVNLWASWCPPCRKEMPSIEKLAQSVNKDNVAFVMLSLDDNFEKAKSFMKKQQINLPLYYPAENLPSLFDVQGIPSTFIFNEDGQLIQRIDGGDDYNAANYKKMLK